MPPLLRGFGQSSFRHGNTEKTVYRRGQGPGVLLIHELPGMVPECIDLAHRLSEEGFTVYLPLLFGEPGVNYGVTPLAWACIWKEFTLLRSGVASPITTWLRALGRQAHEQCGGPGIGAIGMCLTGGFALGLMMDKSLLAPVLSQPSLPFFNRSSLGVSDGEWENAKQRSKDENLSVLGLRFKGDPLCPTARFTALKEGFGDRFQAVELEGSKHSVLTLHFKDIPEPQRTEVWRKLTSFLNARLKPV